MDERPDGWGYNANERSEGTRRVIPFIPVYYSFYHSYDVYSIRLSYRL